MNNTPQEEFIILNKNLEGILNSLNPFRSQVISIERSLLISKLSKKHHSEYFNTRNSSFENNNFRMLNETNENKTTADLIKNSMKKINLNGSGLQRSTLSKMSINNSKSFMNNSKSFMNNNNSQKLIQQIFKKNSSFNEMNLHTQKIETLDNVLKKTRTPLLKFIDSKNFIIAGNDFLRVFHLSESLW